MSRGQSITRFLYISGHFDCINEKMPKDQSLQALFFSSSFILTNIL